MMDEWPALLDFLLSSFQSNRIQPAEENWTKVYWKSDEWEKWESNKIRQNQTWLKCPDLKRMNWIGLRLNLMGILGNYKTILCMIESLGELVNPNLRITSTFANPRKDKWSWKILKWGINPTYQTNLKPVLKLISERNYMILCQNKYFGSKLWLFSSSFERLRCMHIFFQEIRPDTYKGFYLLQSFIQGSNMPTEAFFVQNFFYKELFTQKLW